jgi:hypothetical protein
MKEKTMRDWRWKKARELAEEKRMDPLERFFLALEIEGNFYNTMEDEDEQE